MVPKEKLEPCDRFMVSPSAVKVLQVLVFLLVQVSTRQLLVVVSQFNRACVKRLAARIFVRANCAAMLRASADAACAAAWWWNRGRVGSCQGNRPAEGNLRILRFRPVRNRISRIEGRRTGTRMLDRKGAFLGRRSSQFLRTPCCAAQSDLRAPHADLDARERLYSVR